MKQKVSNLLSTMLTLCILLAFLPVTAWAADTDFVIENGVLNKYNGSDGTVVIPDNVTRIGDWAFANCSSLTSVTIPDGVTSIGNSAFRYCNNLTSVTISNSVISIGNSAFSACSSLTSIMIPNSVTNIETPAFAFCDSLTSINIASGNPAYCSIDGILFSADQTLLHTYPAEKIAYPTTYPLS